MPQISSPHPTSQPIGSSYVNIFIGQNELNKVISLLIKESISFMVTPQTQLEDCISTTSEMKKVTSGASLENVFEVKTKIEQEIGAIIETHLATAQDPDITEVAYNLGLKPIVFKNNFKEIYGKPFYQYYLERKMEQAANLLKTGMKASTVSKQIGYSHPIKFNKMFQKHFGVTPKKYQISFK